MCDLRNKAMHDYQESVTTGQTDTWTPDKVIPICRYALQATQKLKNRRMIPMCRYASQATQKTRHVFVKHGCPGGNKVKIWQKSLSPTF